MNTNIWTWVESSLSSWDPVETGSLSSLEKRRCLDAAKRGDALIPAHLGFWIMSYRLLRKEEF
jgi:hypothetical protein